MNQPKTLTEHRLSMLEPEGVMGGMGARESGMNDHR